MSGAGCADGGAQEPALWAPGEAAEEVMGCWGRRTAGGACRHAMHIAVSTQSLGDVGGVAISALPCPEMGEDLVRARACGAVGTSAR